MIQESATSREVSRASPGFRETNSEAEAASVSSNSANVILRAQQVTKSYSGRMVLRSVSLELRAWERLALTGPSGSGKTTLLNCLGGVDRPDSGTIELGGITFNQLNGDQLAEIRRRRLGTIFQFFHLLPTLTAAENVELPLQLNGVPAHERAERVAQLLERVQVTHRANALTTQLSGGEMQRIAIARALVHRPDLLLADEPTGNLDTKNGAIILELLRELSDETGTALVLVTHSLEAAAICHRELHLRDGEVCAPPQAHGLPEELADRGTPAID
jgi:ABC-type lipoprotein export system ATPase subunit